MREHLRRPCGSASTPTLPLVCMAPQRVPSSVDSSYSSIVSTAIHEMMHVLYVDKASWRCSAPPLSSPLLSSLSRVIVVGGWGWRFRFGPFITAPRPTIRRPTIPPCAPSHHPRGFESGSWPLFRNATGQPRTPRNTVYPSQVSSQYIKCVPLWALSGQCMHTGGHELFCDWVIRDWGYAQPFCCRSSAHCRRLKSRCHCTLQPVLDLCTSQHEPLHWV